MALTDRRTRVELGERFTDVRVLHGGARFTVLEAHDSTAERRVAVKTPNETNSPWRNHMVCAEGDILAALNGHPHVVTCLEQVELDDGRPALLLEHCHGTVHDLLHSDDAMALPDAIAIGIKLAAALESTHRAGVLHCDVRPSSVLVTEWGEPVLAGFDDATRIGATTPRPPLHRLTPHTAPELLEGGEPTTATDVYGLASTLYELVAGRAAFREYAGESPASVIVRMLSNPVLPIVASHIPIEVSDLLTWALLPNPADRPPSPVWLAEELGRVERREGWPRTRMLAS